jgi:hypothetical protein
MASTRSPEILDLFYKIGEPTTEASADDLTRTNTYARRIAVVNEVVFLIVEEGCDAQAVLVQNLRCSIVLPAARNPPAIPIQELIMQHHALHRMINLSQSQ